MENNSKILWQRESIRKSVMNRKTIRKIIHKKIKKWAKSVPEDKEEVRNAILNDTFVTGGCIASMFLNEPVNDFDVYFKNLDSLKLVADYYVEKYGDKSLEKKGGEDLSIFTQIREDNQGVDIHVKSAGIVSLDNIMEEADRTGKTQNITEYRYSEFIKNGDAASQYLQDVMEKRCKEEENGKFNPIFLSSNAITFTDKIQIVTRFAGSPSEIHENYDFVHCTNYYDPATNELVLNEDALACILSKELIYIGSKYPICSIIRLRKFLAREWTINAGQILKMVWQIKELNLDDYSVLKDQLTGVDTAYFYEFLEKLKDNDPEKIDSAHISAMIDEVFDK